MPTQSCFVQSGDNIRLHAQLHRHTDSTKPTCLLLHGFGDGGYVWDDVDAALRDICSSVLLDLRGHGESEYSPTGVYDLDTNVLDTIGVVEQLGLTSIIVMGHSFGGEIALRVATHLSERTVGTVFIDIAPGINKDTARQATVQMHGTLQTYGSIDEYCSLLISMRPLLSTSAARQLARRSLRQCDDGFLLKLDPAMMKYADEEFTTTAEWQRLLPRVHCPTLVMRGAGSAMVSAASARQMVSLLPRGRLVTVARAGHAVLSDNPIESSASLKHFVTSIISGSHKSQA